MEYQGIVTDNADPEQLGRLLIELPALCGDLDPEWPDWIPPRFAGSAPGGGFVFIPPIGAAVLVEYTAGSPIRWVGGEFGGKNTLPAPFSTGYPGVSGITSPTGEEFLALGDGRTTVAGPAIDLGDGTTPPTHPYLLTREFLTDLKAAVTELIAAIPLGVVPPSGPTAIFVLNLDLSLAVGVPYLSARIKGD